MLSLPVYITSQMRAKKCDTSSKAGCLFFSKGLNSTVSSAIMWSVSLCVLSCVGVHHPHTQVHKDGRHILARVSMVSKSCRKHAVQFKHTPGLSRATMLWDTPDFNASCGERLMKCLWAAHYFPLGRGVGADVFVWNKKQIPAAMERRLIPVVVN